MPEISIPTWRNSLRSFKISRAEIIEMSGKTADTVNTVGRRKTSVARVRVKPGSGNITVNKKPLDEYFDREALKVAVKQPLVVADSLGGYDIWASIDGGGTSGQAGALRHGIARALLKLEPDTKKGLRAAGVLTRDPRMKERKKYGQKGARKRFQFSKR